MRVFVMDMKKVGRGGVRLQHCLIGGNLHLLNISLISSTRTLGVYTWTPLIVHDMDLYGYNITKVISYQHML